MKSAHVYARKQAHNVMDENQFTQYIRAYTRARKTDIKFRHNKVNEQ